MKSVPMKSSLLLTALLLSATTFSFAADLLPVPLTLPPGGVEVLPLVKGASYVGDAIKLVDCPEDKYLPFGTCHNYLFGGLAMYDSHVAGLVQVKFYPPAANISHFEVSHPGNLAGDDAVMKAPVLYELPVTDMYVFDDLALISSGDLNLLTGEVKNFVYRVNIDNSYYHAFADANPRLKAGAFAFPGAYGSTAVKFTQRRDGKLDITMSATTFAPLGNQIFGEPVRFPMPFCGPQASCASIQAPNSALHPHIQFTTDATPLPACGQSCPAFTPNSISVYTVNTAASETGDHFDLNIPQLGGNQALAQSHLMGRVQFQFGEPSGGTLPFALSLLPASGLLAKPPDSPLIALGVGFGLLGADTHLLFPKQDYYIENVLFADDTFQPCVGAIDLKTGQIVGDITYRGFLIQNLLLSLLSVNNGAIPPGSFLFRGPASFTKDATGQTVFHMSANLKIDFAGFLFPSPELTANKAFPAGTGSTLDPILLVQATSAIDGPRALKTGSATSVKSQLGDTFSYTYSIPCDGVGTASFTYTNTSTGKTGGTFTMENLATAGCGKSRGSTQAAAGGDTVTFAGFGKWSKNSDPHLATVQVTNYNGVPYIQIQIDGGTVSSADNPQSAIVVP